jgi:hypothetical protein
MEVLRVMLNSSGVSLLARQDKAAQDLLAIRRIHATGEAAEVAAQVAKEAFGQVGGAQPLPPFGVATASVLLSCLRSSDHN